MPKVASQESKIVSDHFMPKLANSQVAVIDIGTNTMLMLTAEWDAQKKSWINDQTYLRFSRLGENLKRSGNRIPNPVIERNLACLREFQAICQSKDIKIIQCFGTSALRDAYNADAFIERVKNTLGITVNIISGNREAELICKSVASTYEQANAPLYILDIGGGSTELIKWEHRSIKFLKSVDVGCVHVTQQFLLSDPPLPTEIEACRQHIRQLFKDQYHNLEPGHLVAIGGTPTSAYCITQNLADYDPERVEGSVIHRKLLQNIFERLAQIPLAERIRQKLLPPGRADVFLGGLLILMEVMDVLNIEESRVSDRGLRYGVLEELALDLG